MAISCTLGFAGGYVFFFGLSTTTLNLFSLDNRASTGLGLDPGPGAAGVLIGILILVLAVLPRWVGVFWWIHDSGRRTQESLMATGVMTAAIPPILLFSHGVNEVWGASAASGPLTPVAASGVGLAWRRLEGLALQVGSVAVGITAVVISALLYGGGPGASHSTRWLAPLVPYALASGAVVAVAALKGNSAKIVTGLASATVVMTLAPVLRCGSIRSQGSFNASRDGSHSETSTRRTPIATRVCTREWRTTDI